MESDIRGALEKVLDIYTSDNFLLPYVSIFKILKNEGAIDSVKSALIGAIHNQFLNFYLSIERNKTEGMSEKEKMLNEIFLRRIPEVKSKLDILLNL